MCRCKELKRKLHLCRKKGLQDVRQWTDHLQSNHIKEPQANLVPTNIHCFMCLSKPCLAVWFTKAGVYAVSTDSSKQRESSRENLQVDAGFSRVASTCPGSKPAGSPAAREQRGSTAAHLGGSCDFQGSWGCEQTAAPARGICWLTFHSLRVSSFWG